MLLAGLTVKVGRMLRVKNRFWYFLIGFSWCVTFPFLRMSAMLGQPDWFGLIFAFMLMPFLPSLYPLYSSPLLFAVLLYRAPSLCLQSKS